MTLYLSWPLLYDLFVISKFHSKCRFFVASQEVIQQGLKADEWVKSVSELIGGKCGGKDLSAQGSGPNIGCVMKAVETATQFAQQKL